MAPKMKKWAVCITEYGYDGLVPNVFNECIVKAATVNSAFNKGKNYIKIWNLEDQAVDYVREISEEEYTERCNTNCKYDINKYAPFNMIRR